MERMDCWVGSQDGGGIEQIVRGRTGAPLSHANCEGCEAI